MQGEENGLRAIPSELFKKRSVKERFFLLPSLFLNRQYSIRFSAPRPLGRKTSVIGDWLGKPVLLFLS
jgi:hypothetical protein